MKSGLFRHPARARRAGDHTCIRPSAGGSIRRWRGRRSSSHRAPGGRRSGSSGGGSGSSRWTPRVWLASNALGASRSRLEFRSLRADPSPVGYSYTADCRKYATPTVTIIGKRRFLDWRRMGLHENDLLIGHCGTEVSRASGGERAEGQAPLPQLPDGGKHDPSR